MKLKKIEFDKKGKIIAIATVVVGLIVCAIFFGLAWSTSQSQNQKVTGINISGSSFNLNKESYDKDLMLNKENVEDFDKLSSLSSEQQDMFLAAVGKKFCTTQSQAKALKIELLGNLEANNGVQNIYLKNNRDSKYYTASIYDERVIITDLTTHVKGINDELYQDVDIAQSKPTRTTNEGANIQSDTSKNYFVTDVTACESILPSKAANSLEKSLLSWSETQGKELAIYQCTINPESVKTEGDVTSFTVLCFEKNDVNALLVNASFNDSLNQFTFEIA